MRGDPAMPPWSESPRTSSGLEAARNSSSGFTPRAVVAPSLAAAPGPRGAGRASSGFAPRLRTLESAGAVAPAGEGPHAMEAGVLLTGLVSPPRAREWVPEEGEEGAGARRGRRPASCSGDAGRAAGCRGVLAERALSTGSGDGERLALASVGDPETSPKRGFAPFSRLFGNEGGTKLTSGFAPFSRLVTDAGIKPTSG